jgi:hypothetical protein
MAVAPDAFAAWLTDAPIPEQRLTPEQRGRLQAAFHFRQVQGDDYYSTRLLSRFLLHGGAGLTVAPIARLVQGSRPTASPQQGLSSKDAIQQARHRMDGRPYGKLLPRYAGPIAGFLLQQPQASRADLIDFIDQTLGVGVARIAVYTSLKKYGLGRVTGSAPPPAPAPAPVVAAPPGPPAVRPAAGAAPPLCSGARSSRARAPS